jgi:hypothetical protein
MKGTNDTKHKKGESRRGWVYAFLLPAFLVACTTTKPAENQLPEEYLETSESPAFGTIEDESEAYPWTSKQYEDPRFAAQLDNSPYRAEDAGVHTDRWVVDGKLRQEKSKSGNVKKSVKRSKGKKGTAK